MKMIKLIITDFRKITLWGDIELLSNTHSRLAFRGKLIEVKILGLFWVTYKYFYRNKT